MSPLVFKGNLPSSVKKLEYVKIVLQMTRTGYCKWTKGLWRAHGEREKRRIDAVDASFSTTHVHIQGRPEAERSVRVNGPRNGNVFMSPCVEERP